MIPLRILVVDDEPDICTLVKDILRDEGFEVDTAQNTRQARALFSRHRPDLVLLDIWMPDEDGISLLKDWQKEAPIAVPVIIMSGHGTVETAIEATRLGAYEFIEKPLTTAKLLQSVSQALTSSSGSGMSLPPIRKPVGQSNVVLALREQSMKLAQSGGNISIVGEPSTGKAALAQYIHSLSDASDKPFTLLYDASLDKKTLAAALKKTSRGTLTIKNIHELPPAAWQDIVLSANELATRKVRLIITGVGIPPELADNDALNLTEITVAALRDHVEDIPELVNACTDYWCQQRQLPYRRFSIAAQNRMLNYNWPNNLGELNNLVCHLLEQGGAEDVSLKEIEELLEKRSDRDGERYIWVEQAMNKPMREAREIFERIYLTHRLQLVGGSVSRLAAKIGMERSNLYRKLRSLGVTPRDGNKNP